MNSASTEKIICSVYQEDDSPTVPLTDCETDNLTAGIVYTCTSANNSSITPSIKYHSIIRNYLQSPLFKELVACMLLCTVLILLAELVPLHHQPVPYQLAGDQTVILDFNYNYPYKHPEISDTSLVFSVIIFPIFVVILLEAVFKKGHHFHAGMCTLFIAFGLTGMITDFTKRFVGRLRPNFYALCDFNIGALECQCDNDDSCNYDEARKSFISGHASLGFCGMTVLAQLLVGTTVLTHREQLHTKFSEQQQQRISVSSSSSQEFMFFLRQQTALTCAAFCVPLVTATYISMTRIRDNWHHPSDVVAGAMVGVCCAVVAYRLWYPPVHAYSYGRYSSVHVGVPYYCHALPQLPVDCTYTTV